MSFSTGSATQTLIKRMADDHSKEGCPDGWIRPNPAYLEEDVDRRPEQPWRARQGCSICSDELIPSQVDALCGKSGILPSDPRTSTSCLRAKIRRPHKEHVNRAGTALSCTLAAEMLSARPSSERHRYTWITRFQVGELYRIPGRASHREPLSTFFHRLLGFIASPVLALAPPRSLIIVALSCRPPYSRSIPAGAVAPVEALAGNRSRTATFRDRQFRSLTRK